MTPSMQKKLKVDNSRHYYSRYLSGDKRASEWHGIPIEELEAFRAWFKDYNSLNGRYRDMIIKYRFRGPRGKRYGVCDRTCKRVNAKSFAVYARQKREPYTMFRMRATEFMIDDPFGPHT
jgi:hypothetical protein